MPSKKNDTLSCSSYSVSQASHLQEKVSACLLIILSLHVACRESPHSLLLSSVCPSHLSTSIIHYAPRGSQLKALRTFWTEGQGNWCRCSCMLVWPLPLTVSCIRHCFLVGTHPCPGAKLQAPLDHRPVIRASLSSVFCFPVLKSPIWLNQN